MQNTRRTIFSVVTLLAVMVALPPNEALPSEVLYRFTTLAGRPEHDGYADGRGSAALFNAPCGIAVDSDGKIFVADERNNRIRQITPDGMVRTYAGVRPRKYGVSRRYPDAHRQEALLNAPKGLLLDGQGDLYFTDGNALRKIDADGMVKTVAGNITKGGYADGPGNVALFQGPHDIAIDRDGNILVVDYYNNTIRMVESHGMVSTLTTASPRESADASGSRNSGAVRENLFIRHPRSICVGSNGDVFVANNSYIYRISGHEDIVTVIELEGINRIAIDGKDNIYVTSVLDHTILRITPEGNLSIIGGREYDSDMELSLMFRRYSRDGIGDRARFRHPNKMAVDNHGVLYITDSEDHSIRVGRPIR